MSTSSVLLFAQVACLLIVGSVAVWENHHPGQRLPTAGTLPAGYNNYPDIGTAYKFNRDRRTWNEAKRVCASEGARLPIIDGTLKLARLTSIVEYSSDVWIGLNRNGSQWRAVDGSTPAYIPWGPQQPTAGGDCAVFRASSRGVYNSHCFWQEYFVCEIITGTTSAGGGSSHLYPDLRQIFNPSQGNSTHGNPWQRNPPYNGQPSNWNNSPYGGNPTQRNPPYNGQPSNWNNHPTQRYPAGQPSYGNNPRYGNSSYTNPPYGSNPTQRNPPFGHPSYGNNPSYGIQTTRNPYFGGPSYGSPTAQNPSYGNPSYGTQSPHNPSYNNPSYGNPSYGNPSHDHNSHVTPSYGDFHHRNPSHGNSSTGYRGR